MRRALGCSLPACRPLFQTDPSISRSVRSSQIRTFFFEDLKGDSDAVVEEAFSFLGLDPVEKVDSSTVHNLTRLPRSQVINRLRDAEPLRWVARQLFPESIRSGLRRGVQQWNGKSRPPLDPSFRQTLTERGWLDVERLEALTEVDLSRWAG